LIEAGRSPRIDPPSEYPFVEAFGARNIVGISAVETASDDLVAAIGNVLAELGEFAAAFQAATRRRRPPEPPSAGPRPTDPVNPTDEDSRVMPVPGGGFDRCHDAQASMSP